VSDLGFSYTIWSPGGSGPFAAGRTPFAVQVEIDPNSLDDGLEGISISWGDGATTVLSTLDWSMIVGHTYARPGRYHAKATSIPSGESRMVTFIARALAVAPKDRRTRFVRPH